MSAVCLSFGFLRDAALILEYLFIFIIQQLTWTLSILYIAFFPLLRGPFWSKKARGMEPWHPWTLPKTATASRPLTDGVPTNFISNQEWVLFLRSCYLNFMQGNEAKITCRFLIL